MDSNPEDKRSTCRLCLSKIFVSHSLLEEDRADILESITSIRVKEDENLPQNCCTKCWLNLKYAFHIQQNFLEADRKLRMDKSDNDDKPEKVEISQLEVKEEDNSDNDLAENELEEKVDVDPLSTDSIKFENQTNEQVLVIYKVENKDTSFEELKLLEEKVLCKICGDKVPGRDIFEHTKNHFFARYKCEECDTYVENVKTYREHCLRNHEATSKNSSWKCGICQTSFIYKPLYLIHQSKAHRKTFPLISRKSLRDMEKSYDCPYCKRKFRTEALSLSHIKSHQKKKCDICSVYITPSNFSNHYKAHTEAPVICHLCGATYKNSVSLRSHIHYTHSKRTFMCEFCQKTYKKSYDLLLHIRREHLDEKNHVCDVCGKRFYTLYTLNKHKKMTHQKLRPFTCQFCKKKFSSKHAKVTHERQHTNITPYKCKECGLGFRQNVSLKSHRKSAHNYVEEMTCECHVCGKKFGSNFAVLSHMRLH